MTVGMTAVSTHLMFQGDAKAAIELYTSVFPEFSVESMELYVDGEAGAAGLVKEARATFCGQGLVIIDSPIPHEFGFTPAMSIFVEFQDAAALDAAFSRLSEDGAVMMPLDDYGFSRRFGWLADRFGVSWQLNLPHGD